eukprot:TRINITY_DN20661_c0_g1_i3.p1 TRINITY_DN20661_c0_g1~~TRINITY_DN20661_c0_g1_i3.p1  ORF type:complete len:187 (-),score=23.46 TRINITY_DN20661_c0_g1_i3:526-1086(-)
MLRSLVGSEMCIRDRPEIKIDGHCRSFPPFTCWHCQAPAARQRCSACRTAQYCNVQCQTEDWSTNHYHECTQLSASPSLGQHVPHASSPKSSAHPLLSSRLHLTVFPFMAAMAAGFIWWVLHVRHTMASRDRTMELLAFGTIACIAIVLFSLIYLRLDALSLREFRKLVYVESEPCSKALLLVPES